MGLGDIEIFGHFYLTIISLPILTKKQLEKIKQTY